jgi:DNA-binding SARP family transcriptional activator
MSILRVRLFGKFDACCDGLTLSQLNASKAQELFCYLLLYRDRPHPRETLATLLWGEHVSHDLRGYLRKALWHLRSALNSDEVSLDSAGLLSVDDGWIQFNAQADLWLDVAVFEQAFYAVQGVEARELSFECMQALQRAVDLYQGDLLEGWYYEWCLYERERLRQMYMVMLDKLAEYCEVHGHYETGLVYAMLPLRCEPARERTHRRLMRLYYMTGDRTAALRQYERCVAILREELGVSPTQRTETLYKAIQANQLERPQRGILVSSTPPDVPPNSIPNVLYYLKEMYNFLSYTQSYVQHTIQLIEGTSYKP